MSGGDRERGRKVTPDEARLWELAMGGAKPLPRDGKDGERTTTGDERESSDDARSAQREPARPGARASGGPPSAAASPVETQGGVDKRTAQRLRRGQLPVERRLDLHGQTLAQAHQALDHFLAEAQAEGRRCVLVITGKGLFDKSEGAVRRAGEIGPLRREVPRWLAEPPNRARVLAWSPAQQRHGGDGALYVLLRRRR